MLILAATVPWNVPNRAPFSLPGWRSKEKLRPFHSGTAASVRMATVLSWFAGASESYYGFSSEGVRYTIVWFTRIKLMAWAVRFLPLSPAGEAQRCCSAEPESTDLALRAGAFPCCVYDNKG